MSYLAFAKNVIAQAGCEEGSPILEPAEEIGAVLIRSHRFGEVWVVLVETMIEEIADQERIRATPRPVLSAVEMARLAGKPEPMIEAVLRVAAVFPGSRVIQ